MRFRPPLDATLAPWRAKYPEVQTGWELVLAHPARVQAGASARADLIVASAAVLSVPLQL